MDARQRDQILKRIDAVLRGEQLLQGGGDQSPIERELVAGVLRWLGRIEFVIDQLAQKKRPSGFVRKALYQGIYPILAQQDAPLPLVISSVVQWVKERRGEPSSKFVNAILREAARQREGWAEAWESDQAQAQVQFASVSEALWREMVASRGEKFAKAFCHQAFERPEFWMVKKNTEKETGFELVAWKGKRAELIESFKAGEGFVQDPSSFALTQRVAAEIKKRSWAHRVVDLCASPGGKSAALAWQGMTVLATDRKAKRLQRLQETAQYVGQGRIAVCAWGEVWERVREFEPSVIWIDAPCSGTGTIQKHPEIKWSRGEVEWLECERAQRQLLDDVASQIVDHPNCAIVYSVCSVLKREGEAQIAKFLRTHDQWKCEWEWHAPGWVEGLDSQLQPGDGFYAAWLQLKSQN